MALRSWLVDGARPEARDACRATFRRVDAMLPVAPSVPADDLSAIATRLERVAARMENSVGNVGMQP